MATRAQKVRLGVFMVLAFALFVGSVGTLAGLKLWNPRDYYFIRFKQSISGLEVGSPVKMTGVRVGQVETIVVEDSETVRVRLSLDPGTPVKQDVRAVMTSIGITGLQFIELQGGSKNGLLRAPNRKDSEIAAGESVLQSLTGKATDIAHKMEGVLNNLLVLTGETNQQKVGRLLDSADRLATEWADLATENRPRLKRIVANMDQTSGALAHAATSVDKLAEELGPDLRATLSAASNAARSIDRATDDLRPQAALTEITRAAQALRRRIDDPAITDILASLRASGRSLGALGEQVDVMLKRWDRQVNLVLRLVNDAATNFKSFTRLIKERPSLLIRGETVDERKF